MWDKQSTWTPPDTNADDTAANRAQPDRPAAPMSPDSLIPAPAPPAVIGTDRVSAAMPI